LSRKRPRAAPDGRLSSRRIFTDEENPFMRRLHLLSAVALLLSSAASAHDDDGKASTLAVYGDAPYGTTPTDTIQFEMTPAFIATVNADPKIDLVLHVGDIHSGKQFCTEAYDRSVFQLWTAFKRPLIYTPGDNEWSDCHKAGEGGGAYNAATGQIDYVLDAGGNPVDHAKGDPVANLALVRSIFFPHPGQALGGGNKIVLSQAVAFDRAHPSDKKFVENVIFAQSKVLFVTIDLPGGSNNDTDVWYGAPTQSAAQVQEIDERTGADLRWLDTAFTLAKLLGARGVVIQAQADMWDPEKGAAHQAAYEPFVKSVADHTLALGKPVLMFNGDSHVYQSGNPLSPGDPVNFIHPGYSVPNFHRIVVHGSTLPLEYLRLSVDPKRDAPEGPDDFGPFSWERVILP
jgi:calcineurin-like phosphoesterase family protein